MKIFTSMTRTYSSQIGQKTRSPFAAERLDQQEWNFLEFHQRSQMKQEWEVLQEKPLLLQQKKHNTNTNVDRNIIFCEKILPLKAVLICSGVAHEI